MKSVKSIQKITQAMKMVAASKLRGVQGKTEDSRGLWQPFTALLGDSPGNCFSAVNSRLLIFGMDVIPLFLGWREWKWKFLMIF